MWHWLTRFERAPLLIPFLIYASLRHISYSTRCTKCGKRLFDYEYCHVGLCDKCLKESLLRNPAQVYAQRSETGVSCVNYGEGHLYKTVARRVGQGRVIDVGCGRAPVLFMLHLQNRELHGIDVALPLLNRVKRLTESINFSAGDARGIPFKSDTFDYLLCSETLEHIDGDDAVRECYRVLKPNGVALFTVPNGKGASGKAPEHLRLFSLQSFSSFLQQAGFDIVSGRKFGLYIPFVTRLSGILSILLEKNLPFSHPLNISVPECLATHFFVECRKPAHPRKKARLFVFQKPE